MHTLDSSPKLNIPLSLPGWLLLIYLVIGATLASLAWASDLSFWLALIISVVILGQIVLACRAAIKLYQGTLEYDGSHWRRSKPMVSLLEPHSAYMPLPSIVILRFKGPALNGPIVYLLTRKNIGPHNLRQVRVLLHTNHF